MEFITLTEVVSTSMTETMQRQVAVLKNNIILVQEATEEYILFGIHTQIQLLIDSKTVKLNVNNHFNTLMSEITNRDTL